MLTVNVYAPADVLIEHQIITPEQPDTRTFAYVQLIDPRSTAGTSLFIYEPETARRLAAALLAEAELLEHELQGQTAYPAETGSPTDGGPAAGSETDTGPDELNTEGGQPWPEPHPPSSRPSRRPTRTGPRSA